jgi:formylglycine-generating enzyme required for sulfatase activity
LKEFRRCAHYTSGETGFLFYNPTKGMSVNRALPILLATLPLLAQAQTRERRVAPVNTSQRQNFERQVKVAVLAGVGQYPSLSGLSRLRYPAHDVELLQATLSAQGYTIVSLKEQDATRGSIEQALANAAELADRGQGTVLFFFSGHGFADKGDNYLATFEATSRDLAGTGLAVKKVEALLKVTGAPRQVMFVDACRNEPGKAAGARTFDRFRASAGLRELLSTKEGRISYEDDQLGSGVFTHFLVRGLRGEAAGQDGLITFRDLADYVTDGVSKFGFQRGQLQVPYEAGESSGDFLLAHVTAPPPVVEPPKPNPPATPPGSVKVNAKDGLEYVWIPPGAFQMGCSPSDSECDTWEKPAHQVTISKGYWLGKTPVTQQVYQQVTGKDPSHFKGAKRPVDQVTWDEARDYCSAIGGRLPTEAEWEYAARAGSVQARYGDLDRIAWHAGNSGQQTHEVGQKQPNAFGLYDMLGNVRQWTADWFSLYPGNKDRDPTGPASGIRMQRGGSWMWEATNVRASNRFKNKPGYRYSDIGVRCVLE